MMMLSALFLLILQTNFLFSSSQSFSCDNKNGNYILNSNYANNLDTVLSSIPANIEINGFYNASAGSHDPDIAYATALCRGDVQPDVCRMCIQDLTARRPTECPNQRAVEWEDHCMLRYSNESILGILEMRPRFIMANAVNATNPDEFMTSLSDQLNNLRQRAANGGPLRKVAATSHVMTNGFEYIYALVQCTPDLSSEDCSTCLNATATEIRTSIYGNTGGRLRYPSCNLHYETYSFYNETRIRELEHPVLSSPSSVPQPPIVPATPLPPLPGTNSGAIIIVVGIIIIVVISIAEVVKLYVHEESHETVDEISTTGSLKYTLRTIKTATNDFSHDNKLGQGGFGVVYKGKFLNDQEIVVKRLSKNSGQGDQEFKNEVLLLMKLQHKNLVRLLGFCIEGTEKLLIYEFVQNASLDQFIFDPVKRLYLDWDKRYIIIGGIARGILYLHEDSQLRIIHRDLKPSNVLLDGAMNPKIADFGMARLFERDETQGNTSNIAGTFGYMAPEYARHGRFSIKSDVFSFGVLLLEIISGKKNNNFHHGEIIENLLSFAWKNWHERTPAKIVDPCLRSDLGSMSDMLRCVHIALLCVQENAVDRPTMDSVALMLNSFSITLAIPSKPAFFIPNDYGSNTSALLHDKNSSNTNVQIQCDTSYRNEASISDLYPR